MEYRVYTYAPKQPPDMRYQQRQRARRRKRARQRQRRLHIFRSALLLTLASIVLLVFLKELSSNLGQDNADNSFEQIEGSGLLDEAILPQAPVISIDGIENGSLTREPVGVEPAPIIEDTPIVDTNTTAQYDFSIPVPVSDAVDASYFDDAVFIGDSRTEGLILNTGLWNATSYVYKGLMVNTAFTKPVINKDGKKLSVMDALKSTEFSKVYVMLGINETGWVYSSIFQAKYGELIDGIREINPEAIIYVQGILPVSSKVSSTHSYITNAKISEYNGLICEMAEEKQVYYIDTENAVASANGCLPEDAAADGIHLVKDYCEKWLNYLKTHTVTQ